MVRGLLVAIVGCGLCAHSVARADQVVLPLAGTSQFKGGPGGNLPDIYLQAAQVPHGAPGAQTFYDYWGTLQFSLASLPASAVITSASITYEGDLVGWVTGSKGPSTLLISLLETAEPDILEASTSISASGLRTTSLSDVSALNNHLSQFPGQNVVLKFSSATYNGEVDIIFQPLPEPVVHTLPTLTINYTVGAAPEPASVGVLGVGILMLLRRRRWVSEREGG